MEQQAFDADIAAATEWRQKRREVILEAFPEEMRVQVTAKYVQAIGREMGVEIDPAEEEGPCDDLICVHTGFNKNLDAFLCFTLTCIPYCIVK
jgi:hypothetical protein